MRKEEEEEEEEEMAEWHNKPRRVQKDPLLVPARCPQKAGLIEPLIPGCHSG